MVLPANDLGNARLAGLERDLKLKGYDYNSLLSIFFISYILFEVPSVGLDICFPANCPLIALECGLQVDRPRMVATWDLLGVRYLHHLHGFRGQHP